MLFEFSIPRRSRLLTATFCNDSAALSFVKFLCNSGNHRYFSTNYFFSVPIHQYCRKVSAKLSNRNVLSKVLQACNNAKFKISMSFNLRKINKTTGYHRDSFCFPIFEITPFKRMKAFFFKILSLFILFSNFSTLIFSDFLIFLQKNLTFNVDKTFLRNNII